MNITDSLQNGLKAIHGVDRVDITSNGNRISAAVYMQQATDATCEAVFGVELAHLIAFPSHRFSIDISNGLADKMNAAKPEQVAQAMLNAGPEAEEWGRAFEDSKLKDGAK